MYPNEYQDHHHHHEPHLHNRGEERLYMDPDWHASHSDAQLPALSAIGRGPRGEGFYIGNAVAEDGEISFSIYSDLTGEEVWTSPNLAPAKISFRTTDWQNLVPGVHAPLDITVEQGGVSKTETAYLPAGQPGSLVYLYDQSIERNQDDTYQLTVGDLCIYGRSVYPSKPIPRVNDIVYFKYFGNGEYGFAFGTIEAVGTSAIEPGTAAEDAANEPVVFTARTFVPTNIVG